MQRDEYCSNCGQKISFGSAYCTNCGASLGTQTSTAWEDHRIRRKQRRYIAEPIWGALSFLAFILILILTFVTYPDLLGRIVSYLRELGMGRLVLPPYSLGQPLMYFLNFSGLWGIIFGAIGLGFGRSPKTAISDMISGMYALYLVHFLSEYYNRAIAGHLLVLYALFGLVGVIVLNAAIRLEIHFQK